MLSALASEFDIFLGNKLNASGDSVEWAECLYPLAIEVCDRKLYKNSSRDYFWREVLLKKAQVILGENKTKQDIAWGWKLPESILALRLILSVFPFAKVVFLVRHPYSSSLRRTHLTSRPDNRLGISVLKAAYRELGRSEDRIYSDQDFLLNAITWRFQIKHALEALDENVPAERVLWIKYEELAENLTDVRLRFANFLGCRAYNRAGIAS